MAEGSPGPEDGGSGLRTEAGGDGQEAPMFHKSKNNYFFYHGTRIMLYLWNYETLSFNIIRLDIF